MKRDMDLIRKILMACEEHEHGRAPQRIIIDGYTDEQIGYHVYLMKQADLLHAADVSRINSPSPQAIPLGLTWAGYDFLDASRNDSIWNKAKSAAGSVGNMSLDVLKAVLTGLAIEGAKKAVGLK